MTIRDKIEQMVREASQEAQARGLLPQMTLPDVLVERPQNPEHGDYAATAPLKLARAARMKPLAIAQHLMDLLKPAEEIDTITMVPPGFINFSLKKEWLKGQVGSILAAGSSYGDLEMGGGERVQVEYVSVNPTGPLHIGHGRGAVLGSTLARVLKSAGFSVEQEYYINDAGTQMDNFYRSLYVRYLQELGVEAAMPPEGYMGEYVKELAREIISEEGDRFKNLAQEGAVRELGDIGLRKMVDSIQEDLWQVGVVHDVWFSEQSLFDSGQYDKALGILRSGGYTQGKEGAIWLVSTALGEDKDNVLVRSSGHPTYFASDVAYHYNKFVERGFDRVINIWGADHQGHISRMKAVVNAMGINPDRLQIIVTQMVALRRGEEVVKLSKRSGDIITLREVAEEVGTDACRFFFLARSADSQMDFDLELAKRRSVDNPSYYVQYAHARISSILRLAEERGIGYDDGDVALLCTDAELALIRQMLRLPEVVELVARTLEPQHLPYYAQELATHFHSFYERCRVVSDDEALTGARLKLVKAAQIVLAKTLDLMGMTAPERM
ncbi:MAG: arginine--tRNA ligase [Dehalococcoidia bacterium]